MSGTTSSWSHAKVLPERARPDWISSATISTLRSVQSSRRSRRKPSGGITTPPSPWIGSKSTATVVSSIAEAMASTSPYLTPRKPVVKGA